MMIVVTGASSSGKSKFAEQCLADMGEKKRIYLATMIPWDSECVDRIEKHRKMRAQKQFETLECPVAVSGDGIGGHSAVLLECMSNLVANELYRNDMENPEDGILERILSGIDDLRDKAENLVIVTNEVFSDGEVYSPETERYREILGILNRKISDRADQVYEVVCGIPILLKNSSGKQGISERYGKMIRN